MRGRKQVAQSASVPAPTGGWNARDSLATMAADQAVILDNFFPEAAKVSLRRGHASHVTGLSGTAESLMAFAPKSGTQKLFAASGGKIYDVTTAGAVGAADLTGLANNRWQHCMFGTAGGHFLVIANGADAVRNYTAGSWSTPSITGVTSSSLISVNAYKQRLFFIEAGSQSVWYLPVASIAGAASELNFSSIALLGGYMVAMASWTMDGGDGLDDRAVFITSKGEVLVYEGTDPSSAATWALVGIFRLGAPIGRRCFLRVGPELIVVTQDGCVPLSKALASARSDPTIAVTDKIRSAFNTAARDHGSKFGWQPVLYPKGNMAFVNVPQVEGVTHHQYVMNTATGSWCRFTGMNGGCWEVHGDNLYFGSGTAIYKADTGNADNSNNITGEVKTAFNYFSRRGLLKRFTMVRPLLACEGTLALILGLNIDFSDELPTGTPTYSGSAGSPWDTSAWDTSSWGSDPTIRRDWQSINGIGYCAALRMKVAAKNLNIYWHATDFLFETGSIFG
jgi:hypothetical protein